MYIHRLPGLKKRCPGLKHRNSPCDMSERLRAAHPRGFCGAEEGLVDKLRSNVHQAQGVIEPQTL